jgi:hypothetical protein
MFFYSVFLAPDHSILTHLKKLPQHMFRGSLPQAAMSVHPACSDFQKQHLTPQFFKFCLAICDRFHIFIDQCAMQQAQLSIDFHFQFRDSLFRIFSVQRLIDRIQFPHIPSSFCSKGLLKDSPACTC